MLLNLQIGKASSNKTGILAIYDEITKCATVDETKTRVQNGAGSSHIRRLNCQVK